MHLMQAVQGIVDSLNDAMRRIDHNAKSVQKGSMDLAGAAQSLAEGATDQASAVQELTPARAASIDAFNARRFV